MPTEYRVKVNGTLHCFGELSEAEAFRDEEAPMAQIREVQGVETEIVKWRAKFADGYEERKTKKEATAARRFTAQLEDGTPGQEIKPIDVVRITEVITTFPE